jgi:hypothetical protein
MQIDWEYSKNVTFSRLPDLSNFLTTQHLKYYMYINKLSIDLKRFQYFFKITNYLLILSHLLKTHSIFLV